MFHFTENWDEWQGDYYEQDELQTEETTGKLLRVFVGKTSMKKFYYFIHSFCHSFFHSFVFQSLTVKIQVLM